MSKEEILKLSPPDYSAWVSAHIEAISRASDIPIELLDREQIRSISGLVAESPPMLKHGLRRDVPLD